MKRNKIKPKYLIQNEDRKETINKDKIDLIERIENKIKKTCVTLGLILLMLTWNYIPIIFLAIFKVDYTNFTEKGKILFLMISDILFLCFLFSIYKRSFILDIKNYFNKNWKKNLKYSLSYWTVGLFIMLISNFIISRLTNGALATNEESVRNMINISKWYMAFELIIYAPISEELIFRKSIKNIIDNKYLYVIISGCIFGGLHVLPTLKNTVELLYLIPYCSLGITFALLYKKTNNIFSTITAHAIHNSLALLLYLATI